jgi:hypothetical protein
MILYVRMLTGHTCCCLLFLQVLNFRTMYIMADLATENDPPHTNEKVLVCIKAYRWVTDSVSDMIRLDIGHPVHACLAADQGVRVGV